LLHVDKVLARFNFDTF